MREQRGTRTRAADHSSRSMPAPKAVPPTPALLLSSLIATRPRLEIAVTHSYKRRKHFLIATRNRGAFASCPVIRSVKQEEGFTDYGSRGADRALLIYGAGIRIFPNCLTTKEKTFSNLR